jgi:acyl-CoA thioesterase FadM
MNQTDLEPWKFRIEERVRWGDVDAARIIFYGAYIRFFEIAETEMFRAIAPFTHPDVHEQNK